MLKMRCVYYKEPIRRTMEDLESAIYSLKEAMEEHFTIDTSQFSLLAGQDNVHQTLKKIEEKLELMEEFVMTVSNFGDAIEQLTVVMESIAKIQARALKWQEMSQ